MNSFGLRHPERDLLLPYLDGELPRRQARQVQRHLEACWECRGELEELEKSIHACVRHRDCLRGALPAPPAPWLDLSREIDRMETSTPAQRRPLGSFLRWGAVALSSAALAATLSIKLIERPQPNPAMPAPAPVQVPKTVISPPASAHVRAEGVLPSARKPEQAAKPAVLQAGISDELQVVAALHRLGVDLGDPVEVGREGGRVVVRGAGLAPARQRQIREALAGLPNIDIQFPESPAIAVPLAAGPVGDAAPGPAPAPSRLEAQFAGHAQFEAFSSQVLDREDAAMARVYALHRLAAEFPADSESRMTPENREMLRQLSNEHLAALGLELAAINRAVRPFLGPAPDAAPAKPATWQAAVDDLFSAAKQQDSLLAALLGASSGGSAAPQQLPAALARVQAAMQQCGLLLKL